MQKKLSDIGVTLAAGGIIVLLILPFLTRQALTTGVIRQQSKTEFQGKLLIEALKPIVGKSISTVGLQLELGPALNYVNHYMVKTYGISDATLQALTDEGMKAPLNQAKIDELISGPESDVKKQQFATYGSWIYNRNYQNRSDLVNDLTMVRNNINTYEIVPGYGLDKYAMKNIRYMLARHSVTGPVSTSPWLLMMLSFGVCILGALMLFFAQSMEPPGIKNNGAFQHPARSRKWLGIFIGTLLILFYIILYFYPQYMVSWIALVDPLSFWLKGSEAGQFFLYGFLYTLSVLVMGVRMLVRYRHNRYQKVRTASVMFFQTIFAFLLPEILVRLNKPYFDFKNIWPLHYDFFFDFNLNNLIEHGTLGIFMLVWGIGLSFIAVPLLTYFYGKRWYCSWVCGCGGLAETLGDPFRHLSDKSIRAWRIERVSIYSVLVFAVVMTAGVLYTFFTGSSTLLGINSYTVREIYGGFIGAGFAGVVGTGFYPFLGNRTWCRFGCPLAAYLGIVQRFKSRFRITTNGGQCISCGNCSTYCEMGIDVRSYAQKGENIVRASCVGCGICAAVCPRGVLKLENSSEQRFHPNGFIQ